MQSRRPEMINPIFHHCWEIVLQYLMIFFFVWFFFCCSSKSEISKLSGSPSWISLWSRYDGRVPAFAIWRTATLNNWFIRQRAFIEIWSTREVLESVDESNSSFLSALQTSQVLPISMNAQLTYEPIVLKHFQHDGKFFSLEGFVCWRHERAQ